MAEPSSPEATAVVADVAPAQEPAEPGKRIRQRSDNARGRGGRDGAVPVRGRGRNPKPASRAAAAQPVAAPAPPPTPAPAPQARAEATPTPALAPVELPSVAPIAPPPPPAPTAQDIAPEKSQQPAAAPAGILGSVPPGLGWDATLSKPPGLSGWGTSIVAEDAGLMAIDSKRSADSMSPFAPSLDPIAVKSPIHEASDPPIERPKSAAGIGAVSRPRSSGGSNSAANSLGVDVLPNGMPALPADLSLDGPTNAQADTRSQPFGGSSHSSIGPAAFPGVLFSLPSQQGSSMWQQFSQPRPSTTQQVQPQQGAPQPSTIHPQTAYDLNAAKQAFYKAGGDQAFSASYSSASTSSQFGAFSTAQFGQGMQPSLQFGQLQTAFGSAPFVPTGSFLASVCSVAVSVGTVLCYAYYVGKGASISGRDCENLQANSRTGALAQLASNHTGALGLSTPHLQAQVPSHALEGSSQCCRTSPHPTVAISLCLTHPAGR